MAESTIENYEQKLLDLAIKAEKGKLEIITRILNREGHTLGIMPTGGGKSVCSQIPALIQENLTVVVSPLIALMKDHFLF